MKNKYGLPEDELKKIRKRDKSCVYCHKEMVDTESGGQYSNWATIEHLNHLPPWNDISTVAFCCGSCNSSRSNKKLLDWFRTPYCIERNINHNTVADSVKEYIKNYERKAEELIGK